MSADVRDQQLGEALGKAVTDLVPDPEARLSEIQRRGTARRAVRLTAMLSALAVFLGGVAWAALWVRGPAGDFAGAGSKIDLPYANGQLELPREWHGRAGNGRHVVALFLSTNPHALSGLVRGCGPPDDSCQIDSLPTPELGHDEAFVQVWAVFGPRLGDAAPPLPELVERGAFEPSDQFLGEPIWSLGGTGKDRGFYRVTFWVGSGADPRLQSDIDAILAGLKLPATRTDASAPGELNATPIGRGWSLYHDPRLDWSLEFPTDWRVQPFDEQCRISWHGIVVANVDHHFRPPDTRNEPPSQEGVTVGCAATWDMRGLPFDAVVVEIRHFEGGPSQVPSEEPDTEFPLSLDVAHSVTVPEEAAYGAPQARLELPFQVRADARYAVTVWFGPAASASDRAVVERIVASLRTES